jgi:hypothetical protein
MPSTTRFDTGEDTSGRDVIYQCLPVPDTSPQGGDTWRAVAYLVSRWIAWPWRGMAA